MGVVMTDSELENVKMFVVEYYIYLDIMSKLQQPNDIIVFNSPGGSNESTNQENN